MNRILVFTIHRTAQRDGGREMRMMMRVRACTTGVRSNAATTHRAAAAVSYRTAWCAKQHGCFADACAMKRAAACDVGRRPASALGRGASAPWASASAPAPPVRGGSVRCFALRTGFVGLPNVGKSTLFNAIVENGKAEAANFPFCTIEVRQCMDSSDYYHNPPLVVTTGLRWTRTLCVYEYVFIHSTYN